MVDDFTQVSALIIILKLLIIILEYSLNITFFSKKITAQYVYHSFALNKQQYCTSLIIVRGNFIGCVLLCCVSSCNGISSESSLTIIGYSRRRWGLFPHSCFQSKHPKVNFLWISKHNIQNRSHESNSCKTINFSKGAIKNTSVSHLRSLYISWSSTNAAIESAYAKLTGFPYSMGTVVHDDVLLTKPRYWSFGEK